MHTLLMLTVAVPLLFYGFVAVLGTILWFSGMHRDIWQPDDHDMWHFSILITIICILLEALIWAV